MLHFKSGCRIKGVWGGKDLWKKIKLQSFDWLLNAVSHQFFIILILHAKCYTDCNAVTSDDSECEMNIYNQAFSQNPDLSGLFKTV